MKLHKVTRTRWPSYSAEAAAMSKTFRNRAPKPPKDYVPYNKCDRDFRPGGYRGPKSFKQYKGNRVPLKDRMEPGIESGLQYWITSIFFDCLLHLQLEGYVSYSLDMNVATADRVLPCHNRNFRNTNSQQIQLDSGMPCIFSHLG